MIRPININLNAAHPELPLVEATTFTGAPSSVFIRGVPKAVGNWSITAVSVAVTYPDNTTTARAAVESAEGVWVVTIPGTATSGRTAAGFRILADGIDENGAAVTGYVLGFADFAVLSFFPIPVPGETFFYLRYFDTMPTAAKKMDVTTIDGILKYYNGTAWLPFTDLSNYYTAEQTDEAIDKLAAYYITADAQGNPFATRAALVNAQTYYSGGAVRIPTRNDYAVVSADETHGGAEWRYIYAVDDQGVGQWEPQYAVEGVIAYDNTVTPTSASGVKSSGIWSAIWGALSALPTGFTSLYDWVVGQLAGKANDNAVVHTTGNETVGGVKTFDPGGVVVNDPQTGFSMKLLDTGIAVTDGSDTAYFYVPSIAGGGGTFALLSDVTGKADRAPSPTAGNLAALDAEGNPVDSDWTAGDLARYALVTKTISNGAVSLDDRASNSVTISATLSPNTLTINFPTAPTGKLRDFALRLNIAAGVTAPELAWPQGVTLENNGGEVPEIADGGTGGSSTILYFSESENNGTTAKFTVKGETLTAITQA